jgi:hypothetical protein
MASVVPRCRLRPTIDDLLGALALLHFFESARF